MLLNEELENLIPKVKYKQIDEYIDLAINEYNNLNKEVQDYLEEEIEFIKGLKEELKGFTIVAKEMEEGEYFNLDLGFSNKIWVQIEDDKGSIVGQGGLTENNGVATINLTLEGDYWIVVKESEESVKILEKRPLKVLKEKLEDLDKEIKRAENTTIAPISEDGKDIYSDQKWTKQEDKDKLDLTIREAKIFLNNNTNSDIILLKDLISETTKLKDAVSSYEESKKYGFKNRPSTGVSSDGGSSSSDRDKNKDKDYDDDRRDDKRDDRRDRYYDDGGRRYSSSTDEVRYFKDLAGYAWAEPAIKNLSMRNIIKGKTEDKFDPSANIKRGEFAVIVARYLRLDTTNTVVLNNFDDVSRDKYYYTAVNLLANKGIIEGKGARRYDPEAPITRQEIAKIVASLDNKSVGDKTSINKFKDHGKIASWAKEPMAKLVNSNILIGYGDGTVRPQGNAKRAEVAVMIYRLGN